MLVVISPAKRLDWAAHGHDMTEPEFRDDANRLARTMRNLPLRDLKKLMNLSDDLARLNRDRFRDFADEPEAGALRPAALAFAGDTYLGLDAASLDADAQRWARDHLRILSGLYGVLRPYDAIQPYRLEMGSRLKTRRGKTLYDYWRDAPARALNAAAGAAGTAILVNCASQEYFGAVQPKALKLRVITPTFLEERDGERRIVSFFAKRARGSMARFILQNRVAGPDALREFDYGGYRFDPEPSSPDAPVFVRSYEAAEAQAAE